MSIPLLSNSSDGVPIFSLALNIFYPRDRSDVPNINVIHHFVPVDEILIDESEAILRDGNEELSIFVNKQDNPCEPSTPCIQRQLGKRMEELQVGFPQPDFSSCEFLQENHFCSVADVIKDDVSFLAPNICQTAWGPPANESCVASMEILDVTPGFRERLFLGSDDPIHFIASETYDQYFDVSVKFPCVPNVRTY
ncbi:hypothetical protein HOLleu_36893 [Holothuria leucospilota]|uniref:Uncharacterized protein n=1 Tax=Holothuria leucospilota TaxID=206669 RepID=A0A9Q0YMU5_HOLLE|nr:hypothetical protein HOLleu_36893 [Holothuria leucospilota]